MGLHGDLSTLDLTSLFQNLESARKTGVLRVEEPGERTDLYFEAGQLALIAYEGRTSLVDLLLATGAVTPAMLELAKKHKRRGQGPCAALVESGAIAAEQILAIATARLTDDACEVLAAKACTFEFIESEKPSDEFDADERALGMKLPASPLLLESARRSDHWAMIREHLPSDSAHYVVGRQPRVPADKAKARFQDEILALLDGARTVRDVVSRFPTKRFQAYELLAELAKSQTIRPIPVGGLNARILELARRDRKRALALLEHALEQNPHHLDLLCTKAMLAEKMDELEKAVEALKLVVHLQLESEDKDAARTTLDRLKKLDERDPYAWEKSFDLACEERRDKDAVKDSRTLIEIYGKSAQHRKVVGVLERMSRISGSTWEHVRELAHARAAAGERDAAVKGLERFAAELIALESYPLACKAYEEVIAIHPSRARAKTTLEELRSGALAQRKARWRRVRRRALAAILLVVVLPWMTFEALARGAYREVTRGVVRERLLESGQYGEVRERYRALLGTYGWTTTGRWDVTASIEELGALVEVPRSDPPPSGPDSNPGGEAAPSQ